MQNIDELLLDVINKIKSDVTSKQHTQPASYYVKRIKQDFSYVQPEIIVQACEAFWESKSWDKPVAYFRAIIQNAHNDTIKKKEKEAKMLGSIPPLT